MALTKADFNQRIANFYIFKTGIGTNNLLMTVISFVVALSIFGQTFHSFILENLKKFGALKAIGANGRELVYTILLMPTVTALVGYGLGIGLVTLMISGMRARLCGNDYLLEPGIGAVHGIDHCRFLQPRWHTQGSED